MNTVLLGRITINVTAIHLADNIAPVMALSIYDKMAKTRDPKLVEMTETYQLAWTEVPANSEAARNLMLQQILGFMTKLPHDGSRVREEGMAKVVPPDAPKRETRILGLDGRRLILPPKEEGDESGLEV